MSPRHLRLRHRLSRLLAVGLPTCVLTLPIVLAIAPRGIVATAVLPGAATLMLFAAIALCVLRARADRAERTAWIALACAITSWMTGDALRTLVYGGQQPLPSWCDVFYLGFYPCGAVALLALLRARVGSFRRSLLLDGAIAVAATAALAGAVIAPAVLASASTLGPEGVLISLVYPVAAVGLLSLVVGALALTGWRPAPDLAVVGAGLALFAVSDAIFVLYAAQGVKSVLWLGTGWIGGLALLGLASNLRPDRRRVAARGGVAMFLVPLVSAALGIGLLMAGTIVRLPVGAMALAAGALVLVIVRTGVTFRENVRLVESRRLAVTDDLTGLGNRRRLGERMTAAFAALGAGDATAVGLLLIDLNRFKELNDTLGHHVGDRMLASLGDRLEAALPEADLVARLGGDEFAVLFAGDPGPDALAGAAARIRGALEAPFLLDGLELHVDGSVGGALAPEDAADPSELLQRADVAMYEAKRARSPYERYRADRDRHTRDRLQLSEELRSGIAAGELEVHYQPKGDLQSGRITGVEALVRWRHPVRGLLAPDEFIGLAEETGLMRPLTAYVLATALDQAAAWRGEGLDLSMAVNLAMPNLLDPQLPGDVADRLAASGVPASRLVLEITEDVVMADPERILGVLGSLRALGVELSLDDFGTGYSSLAYLKRMPVQEVKIDRSFVMRMLEDPEDAAIVRATTDLGRSLGLRVVAEGVEDDLAWTTLAEVGCSVGQGYHLSRPLPPDELRPLLGDAVALVA